MLKEVFVVLFFFVFQCPLYAPLGKVYLSNYSEEVDKIKQKMILKN